jgi:hypothetical protein
MYNYDDKEKKTFEFRWQNLSHCHCNLLCSSDFRNLDFAQHYQYTSMSLAINPPVKKAFSELKENRFISKYKLLMLKFWLKLVINFVRNKRYLNFYDPKSFTPLNPYIVAAVLECPIRHLSNFNSPIFILFKSILFKTYVCIPVYIYNWDSIKWRTWNFWR